MIGRWTICGVWCDCEVGDDGEVMRVNGGTGYGGVVVEE